MWIKNKVLELVEKHQTNDPFIIAREKNIQVIQHDLHKDIYGFYRCVRRNKFIFINSNLTESEKIFTCGHELGHSTCHPDLNTPFMRSNTYFSIDKVEYQANLFAVELLLSDELLNYYLSVQMTIYDIAALHQIPVEMVKMKFKGLF